MSDASRRAVADGSKNFLLLVKAQFGGPPKLRAAIAGGH
jgi:hypothetical protein